MGFPKQCVVGRLLKCSELFASIWIHVVYSDSLASGGRIIDEICVGLLTYPKFRFTQSKQESGMDLI